MADTKISALTSATTPLAGTELVPIVQGGSTVKTTASAVAALATAAPTLTGPVVINEAVGSSALTLTGATQTTSQPVLNATQTWNNAAVTFTGMRLNVTDTASAIASLFADFQVNGASVLSLGKLGSVTASYVLQSPRIIATTPAGYLSINNDVYLTRKAAANLQLGFADAAAPVAQTLSVQSVVAGTTDTAGTAFTIAGSRGTGTGAGGSIVFQTAAASTTGSTQNALAAAMTINSAGQVIMPMGTGSVPNLVGGAVLSSGIFLNQVTVGFTFTGGVACVIENNLLNGVRLANAVSFGWTPAAANANAPDLQLTRKAAATLQIGNADAAAPIAQTLGVQSVVAGTTDTAGTNFTINGSRGTGTGAGGAIILQMAFPGTTGSAQNPLTNALQMLPNGNYTFAASGVNLALSANAPTGFQSSISVSGNGGTVTAQLLCNPTQTYFANSSGITIRSGTGDYVIQTSSGNTERLRIAQAAGNVTIAAPTSGTALTVAGVAGAGCIALWNGSYHELQLAGVPFAYIGDRTGVIGSGAGLAIRAEGSMDLTSGGASVRLSIAAAGNVTIAAPTSGDALTVTAVAGAKAAAFTGVVTQSGTYGTIYVLDGSTAQTIATGTTPVVLTCWNTAAGANGISNDMTTAKASNKITVTRAGNYRVSYNLSYTCSTNATTWEFYVFNGGAEAVMMGLRATATLGASNITVSATGYFAIAANADIDVRGYHDQGGNSNITPNHVNLNIEYIGG